MTEDRDDFLDEVDLRAHDLLLFRAVDDSHSQFKGDCWSWVAWLTTLKQFEILFERAVAVQAVMNVLADLKIEIKNVQLIEEVDRAGQKNTLLESFIGSSATLCFHLLLFGEETFLADRSEEANHNIADLVFLKTHGLMLSMAPF